MSKLLYISFDSVVYSPFTRSYSHTCQFAPSYELEKYYDIDYITIPRDNNKLESIFLKEIANYLKDKKYDVIYCPMCHNRPVLSFYKVIEEIAPIRIAILSESLSSVPLIEMPRDYLIQIVSNVFTHVICYDENDELLFKRNKTMYWPTAVNSKYFRLDDFDNRIDKIVFSGSPRTEYRRQELEVVKNLGLLEYPSDDELSTELPINFTDCNQKYINTIFTEKIINEDVLNKHSLELRDIREKIFMYYMNNISKYKMCISPYTLANMLPGRVFESMALGIVPICRRKKQHGYKLKNLFEDGRELIYYDNKEELEDKIKILVRDCKYMSLYGYSKMYSDHTMEKRISDLLQII